MEGGGTGGQGRRFTVEEADALLPAIVPLIEQLRAAGVQIASGRRHVREHAGSNGGGDEANIVLAASMRTRRALARLGELGVIVRDFGTGLVDFPSLRDGREVYLCWRLGEHRVQWWHPTDTGVAGRRRLADD